MLDLLENQTLTAAETADGLVASFSQAPDESPVVMVVDDEPINTKVVTRLLELEGYTQFVTTHNAADANRLAGKHLPDLILLDLMMPDKSGFEVLEELRGDPRLQFVPVVILTASTDRDSRVRCLELGATDFVTKPIEPSELVPRVRNVLQVKLYQDRLKSYSRNLEAAVKQRTAQLEASRQDVIHCLARAAEYRDDDTGQHVLRVGKYARVLGEALGYDAEAADILEQAAQLHDVGKIGVPDTILLKPGKLTEEEFTVMQKHCGYGKHILNRLTSAEEATVRGHAEIGAAILDGRGSPVLDLATRIALTHHEWWDGTGYPLGLKGEDIPLEGRITAVADVFDALSTKRCYKEAFPLDRCCKIMQEESGTHFDPAVVDAFFARREELVAIQIAYAEEA